MRLESIFYTEFEGQTHSWVLDEFTLIDINLIVGKNATGKSRVLRVINGLSQLIKGKRQPTTLATGHWRVIFKDLPESKKKAKPDIVYEFEIQGSKVCRETLTLGGVTKLEREKNGRGSIYFERENNKIDVSIPETNLAVTVRRDTEQHPFFEPLHTWANSVRLYEFSKTGDALISVFEKQPTIELIDELPLQNNLHVIVKIAKKKFGRDFLSPVLADMKKIGYEITDVGLMPISGIALPSNVSSGVPQTLYVSEVGIEKQIPQGDLSQGMLRALATIINLHFLRLMKKPSCMLIDDIGEGLDFERATKLISTVIDHAIQEQGRMQIIMTTNDRFVMNNVPLEYWSVMQRDRGNVRVFNPRNSPERFSEFEEFGFNNFDFFAKEFFSQGVRVQEQ